MPTLHYIEHVPFEPPGSILNWAQNKSMDISATKLYQAADFPDPDSIDFLVIMGGPMNIYEYQKYDWLKPEKTFIKSCLEKGKSILGVCLGSQLLADCLGSRVYENKYREIGWFPVEFSDEVLSKALPDGFLKSTTSFHWHGETYDLPEGAVQLGSSEATRNQGFLYGDNVLAMQFHLEVNDHMVSDLIRNGGDDLSREGDFIQDPGMLESNNWPWEENNLLLDKILDRLFIL